MKYESIFENPWFTAPVLLALLVIFAVLMFIYMPRADEISGLKKRIAEQAAIIDRMSKEGTQAALDYVADLEQMRVDRAEDAKSFAKQLQGAQEQKKDAEARTEQSEGLRRQIAAAADNMKARATA